MTFVISHIYREGNQCDYNTGLHIWDTQWWDTNYYHLSCFFLLEMDMVSLSIYYFRVGIFVFLRSHDLLLQDTSLFVFIDILVLIEWLLGLVLKSGSSSLWACALIGPF